jgi:phospholipase C
MAPRISRRSFLGAATAGTLGVGINLASSATPAVAVGRAGTGVPATHLSTTFRGLRRPGSLPNPNEPAGTDQVPEIENFIVVMMENHSFDNILGMLGHGDCWPKGPNGKPTITMSDGHGNLVSAVGTAPVALPARVGHSEPIGEGPLAGT